MRSKAIFILILLIFTVSASAAADEYDREMRRWLIKKPIIKSIDFEINTFDENSKPFFGYDHNRIRKAIFSRESNIFRAIRSERRRRIQRETMIRDTSDSLA